MPMLEMRIIRTSEAMSAPVVIRTRGTASGAFDFLDNSLSNFPFADVLSQSTFHLAFLKRICFPVVLNQHLINSLISYWQ